MEWIGSAFGIAAVAMGIVCTLAAMAVGVLSIAAAMLGTCEDEEDPARDRECESMAEEMGFTTETRRTQR